LTELADARVKELGAYFQGSWLPKGGRVAEVEWRRFDDRETGLWPLGFGHALKISTAQAITFDEHINAPPRRTSEVRRSLLARQEPEPRHDLDSHLGGGVV
jgi:hypothetical protein